MRGNKKFFTTVRISDFLGEVGRYVVRTNFEAPSPRSRVSRAVMIYDQCSVCCSSAEVMIRVLGGVLVLYE